MTSPLKIKKSVVPVVIYTATHRIEGFYHAREDVGRLLDDLNEQGRQFIPVTDARVTGLRGDGETVVSKFLAVNLRSITLFFRNPKLVPQKTKQGLSRPGEEPADSGSEWVRSSVVPDLLIGTVKPPLP
ncbi:MAG TPA: hypothetical protein VKW09_05055 [bacterium]|nr:hypothetical protein [bacterium]